MNLALIVAQTENNVIGKNNSIPWKLPSDLKRFKELTTNNIIIMGRKTFESIGSKPLPNRINIVISKENSTFESINNKQDNNLICLQDLDAALLFAEEQTRKKDPDAYFFVIGGTSLFEYCLPEKAQKIFLTTICGSCEGDTYMPKIDYSKWSLTSEELVEDPKSFFIEDKEKKMLKYYYRVLSKITGI